MFFFDIVANNSSIQTRTKELNLLKYIKKLYLELPRPHKVIITSFSIILLLLLLFPSSDHISTENSQDNALKVGLRYNLDVPQMSVEPENSNTSKSSQIQSPPQTLWEQEDNTLMWKTAKVKNGDSLAKIFKRLGFSARTTYEVSSAKGEHSTLLKKLNVGDTLKIAQNLDGKLVALIYPLSKVDTLYVHWDNDEYQSVKETKTVEIRETMAHGIITTNFWNAGVDAGLNDAQIINLASVFGWDIDFALDIRSGDTFHVIYEKQYVDGDFIGTGKILAAEFVNQDDTFQAIRFIDDEYYSPDGKSMRKAFLRAPVSFKYISSNFKPKRFHPVQKKWKAHRGTDYAAKTGTPVVAAGNGKVTHSTYNKYNGNYVFIQHGNNIVTKYLHFSKRAVKRGQKVKQGQVIGYVGSTGLSAGPHLHYEFLLNGVHRNPRTVKLPDAKPIKSKYKKAFDKLAIQRLNELSGSRQALLAMQKHSHSNNNE